MATLDPEPDIIKQIKNLGYTDDEIAKYIKVPNTSISNLYKQLHFRKLQKLEEEKEAEAIKNKTEAAKNKAEDQDENDENDSFKEIPSNYKFMLLILFEDYHIYNLHLYF